VFSDGGVGLKGRFQKTPRKACRSVLGKGLFVHTSLSSLDHAGKQRKEAPHLKYLYSREEITV